MDTKTLIDDVIAYHELQAVADGDNASLRAQILRNAQRGLQDIELPPEGAWPWVHRVKGGTLTLTSSGDVDLPADFQDFGHYGSVFAQVGGGASDKPVDIMPLHSVLTVRRQNLSGYTYPLLCAVNGFNSTTKRKVLTAVPAPPANVTLLITYDRAVPTLVDQVDPGSGLDLVPLELHQVIYEGTVMRQMSDKGDIRGDTSQAAKYKAALKAAKEANNPMRGQALVMPSYPSAGWGRPWGG